MPYKVDKKTTNITDDKCLFCGQDNRKHGGYSYIVKGKEIDLCENCEKELLLQMIEQFKVEIKISKHI